MSIKDFSEWSDARVPMHVLLQRLRKAERGAKDNPFLAFRAQTIREELARREQWLGEKK